MNAPVPATPAETAAIRRRYLWMMASAYVVDLAFALIFLTLMGQWAYAPYTLIPAAVLMLGANVLLAHWLFRPIDRFLRGDATYDSAQRRITQLPLLSACAVAALEIPLTVYRLTAPLWLDAAASLPQSPAADAISTTVILIVFYFTYAYFVISDYISKLCAFIFRHHGRNLELFYGRYAVKLFVALLVASIGPLALVIVDLLSYDGDRLREEIAVNAASALLGVAIAAYFIGRSLLEPLRVLSRAMTNVAGGDFSLRVPVTSNDEVGELTGQFNTMVEGLRERERIRETFGRYVDESVASTILHREGQGVLAGETREATILFTDIAGFTTIAEHLAPDRLVEALNEYLETVLEPIRAHGGVVNTFIGDGLFASFNMPLACENHAAAAVRAAIDIQRAVGSRTFGDQGVAFATRIGISTGSVIGGSVGAGQRMSFTLLGDTVNLASRLEELNKHHGTRILVSESTCTACNGEFPVAALGSVAVRGRSDAVAIFSVDPNSQKESP
ncbi:MAG: HAMP domain-containing protein [Reyranella sp.]|nr:HAMP domain-containing protein [Reyranella sp.]